MTAAASGAVAGGLVDAMLGGASLFLGAGIGALIGATGALVGSDRLAKVEVLGQPLGGYELRLGPITDPNFPWVMLGRALLHVRLVAERNHARREALVHRRRTRRASCRCDRCRAAAHARRHFPRAAQRRVDRRAGNADS